MTTIAFSAAIKAPTCSRSRGDTRVVTTAGERGDRKGGGQVPGHELIPPSRGDDGTAMSELGAPVLPATVMAAHLESCAAGLAAGLAGGTTRRRAGDCLVDVDDLADVVRHLIAGQRHISTALGRLAGHLQDQHDTGPLGVVPSEDLLALTDVLQAAASAAGYSADALAESAPLMDVVVEAAGGDTRL